MPPPSTLDFVLADGKPLEVQVQECSYGEGGLGCRVWGAAHMLSSQLAQSPEIVIDQAVLELGAGCGLVGLTAAALGAASVALTDALPGLLDVLLMGARLQAGDAGGAEATQSRPDLDSTDSGRWDVQSRSGCTLSVRKLLWEDECRRRGSSDADGADGGSDSGALSPAASTPPPHERTMLRDQLKRAPPSTCPALGRDEQFDVVLGADLLYDLLQASPLARVIRNRLREGGLCWLLLTLRDRELLPELIEELEDLGLEAEASSAGDLPAQYSADRLDDDEVRLLLSRLR